MITIDQIRQKYPQYNKLSDQQLADALYKKYYSNKLSKEYFNNKIGLSRGTSTQSADQETQPPGMLQKATQSLMQGVKDIPSNSLNMILGAGDAVRNFPAQLANVVLPQNKQLPTSQTGQGNAYQAGQLLGGLGTFLGGGEIAKGIPLVEALTKSALGNAAGTTAGSALYGAAVNPQDRTRGALMGGLGGAAVGALPLSLKAIGNAAEYINPVKYANILGQSIKSAYQDATKEAASYYQPVMDQLGNNKIYQAEGTSAYKAINPQDINDYYGTTLRKMHNNFIKDPTLQNAHDLQSQLGSQIRKMQSPKADANTLNAIDAFSNARNALKLDMDTYIGSQSPELADSYNTGSQIFADKVAPFRSNPTISNLATGKQATVTPNKLQNSLTKTVEGQQLDSSHYLSQALTDLSQKINKGKATSDLGSVLAGGLIGEGLAPGVGGSIGGALAGKFIAPSMMRLAQNPAVANPIQKSSPLYSALSKSLLSSMLLQQGAQQ